MNDCVEVYINADQVANDRLPIFVSNSLPLGNREGFQVIADSAGHKISLQPDLTVADWKVGTSRTADGYIIEFEIPLALIDTQDGPVSAPAASGSELLANFVIIDNDDDRTAQTDLAIFWAEDPAVLPASGGEDFWTVKLRLVPKSNTRP